MTIKKFNKSEMNWESLNTILNLIMEIMKLSSEPWLNWKIMQGMRENGLLAEILDKEKEDKSGLMDQCMKVGGRTIKLMAEEDLYMLMEMYTMVNGWMIKHTEKVFIVIQMALNIKDLGKKTNNMETAQKLGQMELNTKVSTFKAKSTEQDNLHGLIKVLIMENSLKITSKAQENTIGPMVVNMKGHG